METLESVASAILGVLKDAGIPAALTGGLAANAWVATEDVRATYDVDVATLIPEGTQFSASTVADLFATRSGIRCMDRTAIAAIAKRQALDRAYIERWARRLGIWKLVSSGLKAPV